MTRFVRALSALPLLLLATACDGPTTPDIENTTFASELNVDISQMSKTPSGVYYRDFVQGTGAEAQSGSHLTVHYMGNLSDGTFVDSSLGGSPYGFTLGVGQVIRGWDDGLVGMKVGGTRQLVIPPSLGYGSAAHGGIPGNSILVFQVQLVSIP